MKSDLRKATGVLLACFFLAGSSNAQSANNAIAHNWPAVAKSGDAARAGDATLPLGSESVSEKALRSFREQFKNGPEPQWFQAGKNFLAIIEEERKITRALFAPNGYLFYALTYGGQNDLPVTIKQLLLDSYRGFTIGRVQQVNALDGKAWVANLHNDRELLVVSVVDKTVNVLFDNRDLPTYERPVKEKQ